MKQLRTLLFLLALAGRCAAQDKPFTITDPAPEAGLNNRGFQNSRLSFGIKAGVNYTGLYGKDLGYVFAKDQTRDKPGYFIGLSLDDKITKHFGLKHALIFNRTRTGVTLSDSSNGPYSSLLKMSYLELQPASITFSIKGLQLALGPYISALLAAAQTRKDEQGQTFNDRGIYGTPGDNESKDKYLQKFDFGIQAGLEYRFSFGLVVGAGYNLGLTDIFQYANSYTLNDTKNDNIRVYNRGCRLYIGYRFR